MKKLLLALLMLCLFCTCKKDNYANLCGGNDPIKNLSWLKIKIDSLQTSTYHVIKRGYYQDKTIFSESSNNPSINSIILYFDCDGNKINFTSEQYNELLNGLPNGETIWQK